jgi:hypothetical protein
VSDGDDDRRDPCRALLETGEACAYERGHASPHWTITDEGEATWTEESAALLVLAVQVRRIADQLEALADLAAAGKLKRPT